MFEGKDPDFLNFRESNIFMKNYVNETLSDTQVTL